MTKDKAAAIKGCEGLYSIGDVARHFKVSKATVWNIWQGKAHADVTPVEAPYIRSTRIAPEDIRDDWRVLYLRGLSKDEAATHLGIGRTTLYRALRTVA